MKKGKKIVMKVSITMADTFGDFIMSRKAKGLSDKTITTYKQQFAAVGKHLDIILQFGWWKAGLGGFTFDISITRQPKMHFNL